MHVSFVAQRPKGTLPLTDLRFTVYVRHQVEHVPVTSPLGRKHILTLLDLQWESVPYCIFSFFLHYYLKAFLPLSEHAQYVLYYNVQYPFEGPPRMLPLSMLGLLATLKPFLEKVLFELEAFYTWNRTKYLGLKANRLRISQGHTSKVASIHVFP
jgi:hypothetical protein